MAIEIILGIMGPWQLALIIVLALLLFGGRKIPDLMKGVGKGIKEFKKSVRNNQSDDKQIDSKTRSDN